MTAFREDLEKLRDMGAGDLALDILAVIAEAVAGQPAGVAIVIIRTALNALLNAASGKVTPEAVELAMKSLLQSLKEVDVSADAALKAKFGL